MSRDYAAEFYGYELYSAGDLKGAHEAWAKAALHGEPASAALLTASLLGEYDEFKHLTFANRPTTDVIVDCLRYAARGEDENSIMLLTSALVGDPGANRELLEVLEIDTDEARRLLGTLPYNFRPSMQTTLSTSASWPTQRIKKPERMQQPRLPGPYNLSQASAMGCYR